VLERALSIPAWGSRRKLNLIHGGWRWSLLRTSPLEGLHDRFISTRLHYTNSWYDARCILRSPAIEKQLSTNYKIIHHVFHLHNGWAYADTTHLSLLSRHQWILLPSQLIMSWSFWFKFVSCWHWWWQPTRIPRGKLQLFTPMPWRTLCGHDDSRIRTLLWPCSPSAGRQAGRSSPKTAGLEVKRRGHLSYQVVGWCSGNNEQSRGKWEWGGNPGGQGIE
jgi:hypothetical protein